MKIGKIIKWSLILGIIALFSAGVGFVYLWFIPHRNVQASLVDFNTTTTELVNEYLADNDAANRKYLQEEGNSKILAL
ncbi:MAG: hypothetical protein GC193_11885 [Cryomorphaceae bacterium]|nr:hypothetical protein [Cryomorphaceae bacterium]